MRRRLRDWQGGTSYQASTRPRPPKQRGQRWLTFHRFGILAVVATLVLGVAMPALAQDGRPYSHTTPQTPEGDDIQGLYKLIFWMAVVVFILVQFLVVYSALRFRRRRNQAERPAQIHGNKTLEITWTVIPAIILLIIAVPTIQTIYDMHANAEDGDITIEVYGKQWWWEFHYPDITVGTDREGNPIPLITANEIRIPEGQKVQFKLYSNNVVHSFWIPQFGGKLDVVPGHENKISFTPREAGTYYGECAEFCGTAHAWMRFVVKVQPQDQFDAWVQAYIAGPSSASAPYVPNGDVTQTPPEFGACLLCHNINGTQRAIAAQAGITADPLSNNAGPNLSLFGCRDTIGAGVLENNAENLALWLANPGLVKDGNFMHELIHGEPAMGIGNQGEINALTQEQIAVLVPYLLSLKPEGGCPEGGLEGSRSYNIGNVADEATAVPAIQPTQAAAEAPAAGAPAAAAGQPGATGAQAGPATHRIEGGDIYFAPTELTVAIGDTIELVNVGAAQHNFVIEGYNDDAPVDMPIGGEVVSWTVPNDLAPGEYVFYCEIPGHRAAGMWGTLTVVEAGSATGQAAAEQAPEMGAEEAAGAQTHRLEGGDIYFNPTEMTVAIGDTIELVNVGASQHDFVIEGYNDDTPVDMPIGGEIVSWTVPDNLAPGTYTYYCSIPGHRAAGMWGTITVVEAGAAPAGGAGSTPVAGTPASGTPTAGTPVAGTPAADQAAAAGPTTHRLEGGDIYFNPTELTVAIGDTIELVNVGVGPHDFVIEGYNDDAPVVMPVGGEVVAWTVPADLAPGQYTYYCSIPGHRTAGMWGTITVTG